MGIGAEAEDDKCAVRRKGPGDKSKRMAANGSVAYKLGGPTSENLTIMQWFNDDACGGAPHKHDIASNFGHCHEFVDIDGKASWSTTWYNPAGGAGYLSHKAVCSGTTTGESQVDASHSLG